MPPQGFEKTVGSRAEVMHGKAMKTSGGLTANDMMYNNAGRIVSKKKVAQGQKLYSQYQDVLKPHQFSKRS